MSDSKKEAEQLNPTLATIRYGHRETKSVCWLALLVAMRTKSLARLVTVPVTSSRKHI